MRVVKLKKMSKGKYRVFFDDSNSLCLYEEVIINNIILPGKYIDEEMYKKIKDDNYEITPYYLALNYIGNRKRSKEELCKYLNDKETEERLINQVVTRLEKEGYIDDEVFAYAYLNDKLTLSNDGPFKVRKALIEYKIDGDVIDNVFSNVNEKDIYDRIDRLIEKQLRLNTKYSGDVLKSRILNYLINLGYDSHAVLERLNVCDFENSDNLEKEYNKVYKRYNSKYKGDKLDNKIKVYLYKKGYNISKINELIKRN